LKREEFEEMDGRKENLWNFSIGMYKDSELVSWWAGELVGWWTSETVRQWDRGMGAVCYLLRPLEGKRAT